MRAKSLLTLSSISLIYALPEASNAATPAIIHHHAARSAAPEPSAAPAWYGPRPEPNRVVDIQYFPDDDNDDDYFVDVDVQTVRDEIAFLRGSSGAQRVRLGGGGPPGGRFNGIPERLRPVTEVDVYRGGRPVEVDFFRGGRRPVDIEFVEPGFGPGGYDRFPRPEKPFHERPVFRYAEYFNQPFFWEQDCPRGECAFEKFPFLEGSRSFSYCEDRCWSRECLGKNCAGCDRECGNIFPGCEARCFSDECELSGRCGHSCWDCGRFMQYRWERNMMSLRERFDVRDSPVIFERSLERCDDICKKPYPGCEVCFERPHRGCDSCLEQPTAECEMCIERETYRETEFYIERHAHRPHYLPRPPRLNATRHNPRPPGVEIIEEVVENCRGPGCQYEREEEIVVEYVFITIPHQSLQHLTDS
jgi:hypothetical protein